MTLSDTIMPYRRRLDRAFRPKLIVEKNTIAMKGLLKSTEINSEEVALIRIRQWDAITYYEVTIEIYSRERKIFIDESKYDLRYAFLELDKLNIDLDYDVDECLRFLTNNGDYLVLYQAQN